MKIGIFAPLANPVATSEYLSALGPAVDERGFHSLWVAEHVVLFDNPASKYPYAEDGRFPAGPEVGIHEPFDCLSYLAAVTRSVRLGTGVCLVPQRNPVYTAKDVATVDWLSGGRLDFGIGVGWLAEEFAALQVPFERRGARNREYIDVLKTLWTDAISSYDGEFYRLLPCRQFPKPLQTPHPPIHVGGHSDPALRRVAAFGQGWYGYDLEPEQVGERMRFLDAELKRRGRTMDEIEVSICPYLRACDLDTIRRYHDAGVDQVILILLAADTDTMLATLDQLAEGFVRPAADL